MSDQLRRNALRVRLACMCLDRALAELAEIDLRGLGGMTRAEQGDYRRSVREAREYMVAARTGLAEQERLRKERLQA